MLVAESISANQVLIPFGRLEAVRCATTGPSCLLTLIYSFTMYPSMLAIRAARGSEKWKDKSSFRTPKEITARALAPADLSSSTKESI